jgi:hypothetical protein
MPDIPPLTPTAIQFLYSSDGSTITLEDRAELEAIAPADDGAVPAGEDFAGFWCELRDADGATLWRTIRRHPTHFAAEVMLDDDSGGYTNVPAEGAVVAFAYLVPGDLTDAVTVALVGTNPLDESGAPPADILVHPLSGP